MCSPNIKSATPFFSHHPDSGCMILLICREEAEMGKFVGVTLLAVGLIGLFALLADIWCSQMMDCGPVRAGDTACIFKYFEGSCVSR